MLLMCAASSFGVLGVVMLCDSHTQANASIHPLNGYSQTAQNLDDKGLIYRNRYTNLDSETYHSVSLKPHVVELLLEARQREDKKAVRQ